MIRAHFLPGRSATNKALVLVVLISPVNFGVSANAATAAGQASATIVTEIVSQPAVVFVQTPLTTVLLFPPVTTRSKPAVVTLGGPFITTSPQAIAQSSPSRLLYVPYQAVLGEGVGYGISGKGASSLLPPLNVDSKGVVTFSVSGANTTSGYTVQLPVFRAGMNDPLTISESTSLILPTRTISGDGLLVVEVGQDPANSSPAPLNVQISFN